MDVCFGVFFVFFVTCSVGCLLKSEADVMSLMACDSACPEHFLVDKWSLCNGLLVTFCCNFKADLSVCPQVSVSCVSKLKEKDREL